MSKYTTEVRFICEQKAGLLESAGYSSVNNALSLSWNKIFTNFPIWDESYRSVLCQKILKHYYLREICCETVGVWLLWLEERMNYIMPYYNQLYETTQLKYNPLINTDFKREGNRDNDRHEGSTSSSTDDRTSKQTRNNTITTEGTTTDTHGNTNRDLFSETPQGALTGVENEEYLTNARKVTDSFTGNIVEDRSVTDNGNTDQTDNLKTASTAITNANSTEDYLEHIFGKTGSESYTKLILEYRNSLLNIDAMIIEELKDLFFGLW